MLKNKKEISKLVSYWLRHNPADADLFVDDFGWVNMADLLNSLKLRGHEFSSEDLLKLNLGFDKVRWEIDLEKNKIRATHGHSFRVLLNEKIETPPQILYHGSFISSFGSILIDGLKPMNRQFVHLSSNVETALEVAKRHGRPMIITVDSESFNKDGGIFYKTSENVWLTSMVPPGYLAFEPWQTVNAEEKSSLLNELKREISHTHLLSSKVNTLELVLRRYDLDDCLFIDSKSSRVYVVHLTWSRLKEERKEFPQTIPYDSFGEWANDAFITNQMDWFSFDFSLSERLRGSVSSEQADRMHDELRQMRREWERD